MESQVYHMPNSISNIYMQKFYITRINIIVVLWR